MKLPSKLGLIRRMPPNVCRQCGKPLDAAIDAATGVDTEAAPGNLSICLDCSDVMVFADDLSLRAPTDAEIIAMAGDPTLVGAQALLDSFRKRRQRDGK
jgi:hypothetical protein